MTTPWKMRIVKGLLALTAATAIFVGVVGFAHTKHGRFLLAYIPGMGACPVGKPATALEIAHARNVGLQSVRGTIAAAARPALGFELGKTTKDELFAWAAKHGVTCSDEVGKLAVSCRNVPASALEGAHFDVDQLYVGIDPEARVTSVEAMRRKMSFEDAVKLVDERALAVSALAGGTAVRAGNHDAASLSAGRFRRVEAELRFTNYHFIVNAMNQGGPSPVVRERYQSISEPRM